MSRLRNSRVLALSLGLVATSALASGCSGGSSKPNAAPSSFTVKVPDNSNVAGQDTPAKYIGFNSAKAAKALHYLRGLKFVKSATYVESKGEIDVVYKRGTTLDEVVKTQTTIQQM